MQKCVHAYLECQRSTNRYKKLFLYIQATTYALNSNCCFR